MKGRGRGSPGPAPALGKRAAPVKPLGGPTKPVKSPGGPIAPVKSLGSPQPTGRFDREVRPGHGTRSTASTACSTPSPPSTKAQPKGRGRGAEVLDGRAQVAAFLKDLGLSRYAEQVIRNGFDDMETLVHLEDVDMHELGMLPVHVVKLRRKLHALRRSLGEAEPKLDKDNEVVAFLQEIGMTQYAEALLQVGFDELESLMYIEDTDMKDIGIPRGHAIKLKRKLQEDFLNPAPSLKTVSTRLPPSDASAVSDRSMGEPSDETKTAVEHSWELVQAKGIHNVGKLFYQHTFKLAPEAVTLFPPEVRDRYREWTAEEGIDKGSVYESPVLRKLFGRYMTAIGCTVAGLRDFSQLVPLLHSLGARHCNYGIKEAHWPILGAALMLTLKDVLGSAFTPPVEAAWTIVFGFMSNIMIEGFRAAEQAAKEPAPTFAESGSLSLSETVLSVCALDHGHAGSDWDDDALSAEDLSTRMNSRSTDSGIDGHEKQLGASIDVAEEESVGT